MKRCYSILAAVLCLFIFSTAAFAQDLVTARDPKVLLEIAKGFGSATLETDSVGDPKISGRINGIIYKVDFYGCQNNRNCTDLLFVASWRSDRVTLEDVNAWNRDKRFGKAYLDSDDDPCLELAVNLDFGVSRKNMEDNFAWWQSIIGNFKEEVVGK